MKRIKVKLIGKGIDEDPYRVNLPTYIMDNLRDAQGNLILTSDGKRQDGCDYINKTVFVLVPDDETKEKDGKIKLDEERIREKYGNNWENFKAEDVEVDV